MTWGSQVIVANSQSNNVIVNQLVGNSSNVNTDTPFDLASHAEYYGIDLHTKKRYQPQMSWHACTQDCLNMLDIDLLPLEDKYFFDSPVSYQFMIDAFPNAMTFMPVFNKRIYLDMALNLLEDFDLQPVTHNISFKKFDNRINRHIPDEHIVFFDHDTPLLDIANALQSYRGSQLTTEQLLELLDGMPFYVLERAFRHTDHNVDKIVTELADSFFYQVESSIDEYMKKTQAKLDKFADNNLVVSFDLYSLYSQDAAFAEQQYLEFCLKLRIAPNFEFLQQIRNSLLSDSKRCLGSKPIDTKYQETIESICNVLLNVYDVQADTQLDDIGWNLGCQLALKYAFPNLNITNNDAVIIQDLLEVDS